MSSVVNIKIRFPLKVAGCRLRFSGLTGPPLSEVLAAVGQLIADEAGERLYRQLLNAANEIGACLIRDELPEGCKDFGQWWASQI